MADGEDLVDKHLARAGDAGFQIAQRDAFGRGIRAPADRPVVQRIQLALAEQGVACAVGRAEEFHLTRQIDAVRRIRGEIRAEGEQPRCRRGQLDDDFHRKDGARRVEADPFLLGLRRDGAGKAVIGQLDAQVVAVARTISSLSERNGIRAAERDQPAAVERERRVGQGRDGAVDGTERQQHQECQQHAKRFFHRVFSFFFRKRSTFFRKSFTIYHIFRAL